MSSRNPTLRLELDRPGGGVLAQVSSRALLGRTADCDVVLEGEGVSRRHASIVRDGSSWVLTDLGSANGTFVNGKRIGRAAIASGDRIRLGAVALRCEVSAVPESAAFEDGGPEAIVAVRPGLIEDATLSCADESGGASTSASVFGTDSLLIARTLRAATDALLEVDDLDGVLERVLELALDQLRAQRGMIALYDAERGELTQRRVRTRGERSSGKLRISSQIARTAIESRCSVLVADAAADGRFAYGDSLAQLDIRSALCAPLCHRARVVGLVYLDTSAEERSFDQQDLEVVTLLASLAAIAVDKARLAEEVESERRIRAHLERYHASGVVERIVRAGRATELAMSSEEREISILFLDLCGFTTLAERLQAPAVTRILNELFARLVETVFAHGGTLDKFTGDGMMIFFGAPFDQHDHAERAVRTALSMQTLLAGFNSERMDEPPIEMRIGVNTGRAVVGDIGAPQRRDYTAIGDAVNVASRLEAKVAQPGWIVIGPETRARLGEACRCEALPSVQLKGKLAELVPYRVLQWLR